MAKIPNIAKAYGSIPLLKVINNGTVNKMMEIESNNIPSSSHIITITTSPIAPSNPAEVIAPIISESMSASDKNLEYIPAVISKIIIGADVLPASMMQSTSSLNLRPLAIAMHMPANAPTPAASVAVKKPPHIPPKTRTINPIIDAPEYI